MVSDSDDKMLESVEDLADEVTTPITIAAITAINSELAILAVFVFGALKVIRKWQYRRIKEAADYVGYKRIMDLMNRDDKSRDILHKILNNILDESSERKRIVFYNYLMNLHSGIHNEFDYHTKLIITINMVTFEEIQILNCLAINYKEILKYASEQKDAGNPKSFVLDRGVSVHEILGSNIIRIDRKDLDTALENISSYGLIHKGPGRMSGTFYFPLTDFGVIFLEFITFKNS